MTDAKDTHNGPPTDSETTDLELSVVIPAHDEALVIGQQLAALAAQTWTGSWEVVVADNCSTDTTAQVVEAFAETNPRFRVIAASERLGLNYARNAGIAASRGRSFALVDADDVVTGGWLVAMGSALRDHELVTGPLELSRLNPPSLANSRGRADERRAPSFYGMFPSAHGNNIGMRKDLWQRIGAFDEDPRLLGSEDVEFSMRAWIDGIVVHFAAEAIVHYRYRTDPRVLWQQGRRYGRSRPMLVHKLHAAGRPRPSRIAGWRSWVWLAVHLPDLRHQERRAAWVWVAANRLGQLEGSIRYRCLFI